MLTAQGESPEILSICQAALRQALHGTTGPVERIAAELTRIREALGIEPVDQPPARQDEVEVAAAILLVAAARRQCLGYQEVSQRLRDRSVAAHWQSPRMAEVLREIVNPASLTTKGSPTWWPDTGLRAITARSIELAGQLDSVEAN